MNSRISSEQNWHTLSAEEALAKLETNEAGITSTEAAARLATHGRNVLPHAPAPTFLEIFIRQFKSPLIYILAAAAAVSLVIGDSKDAGFIAFVLALNAIIGGIQEWRAEQSSRALEKLLKIRASVQRDGDVREIDAEEIVPGDIVWLESGNKVPADIRLIGAQGLEIDESPLTGESLAVEKDAAWRGRPDTPLADRVSMAFAGTTVARGRGRGVVVETATGTAIGRLALDVLSATQGKPPLIERLERFSRMVGASLLIATVIIGAIAIARGLNFAEVLIFAIALAVSAVPEGLPVAVTLALAIATRRMARRGVFVRRLAAVEGLGSCTLIASDKTGTLTCNELTVKEAWLSDGSRYEFTGQGFAPEGEVLRDGRAVGKERSELLWDFARAAALCNEGHLHQRDGSWAWLGDPTDVALLSMSKKIGLTREEALEEFAYINQIPFEPERKYSATFHRDAPGVAVFVKGAPERVLQMCNMADEEVAGLESMARYMAEQGYRVLGFARGEAPTDLKPSDLPPQPERLTFLGFVGMIDPLRPGVKDAVAACNESGITVWMVTGDHPVTALAISRELGLAHSPEQVITGAEVEKASDEELRSQISRARVFARAAPHQKLRLVSVARDAGHFVAVTGDGVNDAPALRSANIGVSMGKSGTDAARDASDLVISDDNFATIVAGIEEGRVAYDNVRKVIYLLVSTGAAEVLMVGLSVIAGLPLPLLPVHLLWLNLVTNGIQHIGLVFEPNEGDVLKRPPRPPRERVFNRLMIERTLIAAAVMATICIVVFSFLLHRGWSEYEGRNALLLLMVLFENVHIGNCRSETKSAFRLSPLRSPILLFGTLTAFFVHLVAMHVPFWQKILSTQPLSLQTGLGLFAMALTVVVAIEIHKWAWNKRFPQGQGAESPVP